jgi:hypothetical protein
MSYEHIAMKMAKAIIDDHKYLRDYWFTCIHCGGVTRDSPPWDPIMHIDGCIVPQAEALFWRDEV